MRFADIHLLHGLWIVGLGAILLFWVYKNRIKAMEKFAGSFVSELAFNFSLKRYIWKNILFISVLFLSIMALARPQWGFEWQEVKREGLDILVAVDTSKSMLTSDVKPNRLERTKLAVRDLLKKLKGDRIGLIAFSGDAFVMSPLTVDYNGFLLAVNDLNTGTIPRGGTAVGSAIEEALKGYEKVPSRYKVLIIITDGENLEGDPLAFAKQAKEKGVKIFCIGVGTKEGELIRVQDKNGAYEFLKDQNGNFVKSQLNESLLQTIALSTGGVYVRSSGIQFGLDIIYDQELSKIEKREIESIRERKYYDRFQIPLGIAFVLLFLETVLPTRKTI